jgi:hypothetical protein
MKPPGDWTPLPPRGVDSEVEMLRLAYERVCHERDRLRDARGFFSRPLGPAPASAGISTALVATFGSRLDTAFLVLAMISLALLVLVGAWYDGKPAYRHLYARVLAQAPERVDRPPAQAPSGETESVAEWYRMMIARETAVIGPPLVENRWRAPWARVITLQDGIDSERTGLRAVQLLWLLVILFLILAVT